MFACPCYIAVLASPTHQDVLRPFETAPEAIGQCYAWLRRATVVELIAPGYVCWLATQDPETHAHVEAHVLALAEPGDDETAPLDLVPDADAPPAITRAEWHALQQARAALVTPADEAN